jgi:hypothetical protein
MDHPIITQTVSVDQSLRNIIVTMFKQYDRFSIICILDRLRFDIHYTSSVSFIMDCKITWIVIYFIIHGFM